LREITGEAERTGVMECWSSGVLEKQNSEDYLYEKKNPEVRSQNPE